MTKAVKTLGILREMWLVLSGYVVESVNVRRRAMWENLLFSSFFTP